VWIGLGVVGLIAIVGQFFWEHRGDDEQPAPRVKQRQKGGRKSRNYQAGRDIRLSDDGPDEQR
jgi:hypothetical protein